MKIASIRWSIYDLLFLVTVIAVICGFGQMIFQPMASYESRFLAWVIGPPFASLVATVLPVIKARREGKSRLEVLGTAMAVATIVGLIAGVLLQGEAFFIHNQTWGWGAFEKQYETFLTLHHIVLSSAGAGALVGLTVWAICGMVPGKEHTP